MQNTCQDQALCVTGGWHVRHRALTIFNFCFVGSRLSRCPPKFAGKGNAYQPRPEERDQANGWRSMESLTLRGRLKAFSQAPAWAMFTPMLVVMPRGLPDANTVAWYLLVTNHKSLITSESLSDHPPSLPHSTSFAHAHVYGKHPSQSYWRQVT